MATATGRFVVLLLALVTVVLRDGSLPHEHAAPSTALYNHEHDAVAMTAVGGGLVPERPEAMPLIVEEASPPPPDWTDVASAPRHRSESRAPPRG